MTTIFGVIQSGLPAGYDLVQSLSEDDFVRFLTVKQGFKQTSVKNVKIRYLHLKKFLSSGSLDLTSDSAERFLYDIRSRGCGNNSLNTYVFMLKQLDYYGVDRGLPFAGFSKGINSFEKTKPMIDVLSVEEIQKILSVDLTYGTFRGVDSSRLNDTYKRMILFLATTGCRYDECASLLVKNVNLDTARAVFISTKNNQPRFAYLSPELTEAVKLEIKNKSQSDYVFYSMLHKKIVVQSFIEDLRKRATIAGVTKRVYPHLFRHSFATQLLTSGVEITRVASILGHKDIQTTFSNYVHLADDLIRKATYSHPLIRASVAPAEILRIIKESIQSLRLDGDRRLSYSFVDNGNDLSFTVKIRTP